MSILRHETILSIPKQYLPILYEIGKVTLLLLLSIWLRLQFITRDTFIDEAFSYFYSKKDILFIISGNDTHPPLYYLILKPFSHWLGNDIITLRMTSIAIWILFAIAFYYFARQRFSKDVAFYALTFAVLSPTLIYYSTELRMYILLLLFFMLNLIAYFNLLDKPNAKNTIIYAATCLLMLYTHLFAALPLLIEALWGWRRKSALKWLILAYSLTLSLFMPQIFITLRNYTNNPIFHFQKPDLISLVSTYSYMFTPPSYAVICFALMLIIGTFLIPPYKIKPKIRKYGFFYAFLLMPPPIFILAQVTSIYHHRLFLTMIPPIYLLLALLCAKLKQKSGINADQTFFIGTFLLATIVNIMYAGHFYDYDSQRNLQITDNSTLTIVHYYPTSYLPYKMHYENTNHTNLLISEPDFTFGNSIIDRNDLTNQYPANPYILVNYTNTGGQLSKQRLSLSENDILYNAGD
jgi:uncharacterized membrane protein